MSPMYIETPYTFHLSRFNLDVTISSLNFKPLKLVGQFIHLESNILSTESQVKIDRSVIICKSDLIDKLKQEFFTAVAISVLLYSCTNWTLNNARWELQQNAVGPLKKSWKQHPTKCKAIYFSSPKPFNRGESDILDNVG